jgi:excisionase family DNA binding protein
MGIDREEVLKRQVFALTTSEVARMLNVHPNTVKRAGDKGLLAFFRVGDRGDRRYLPSDVEDYINNSMRKALR